jgi:hypothetical protein
MSETYRIHTIKDIFDQVPVDRVGVLISELGVALSNSMHVRHMVSCEGVKVEWPDYIDWVDDGAGNVVVKLSHGDTQLLSIESRVSHE